MPHGKWKHETSSEDFSKGRYVSGKPVGKWKTVVEGNVYRKSRLRKNLEAIKLYHPNGVLKSKGLAQIDTVEKFHNDTLVKEIHWYYTGKWLHFSSDRKLIRVETYVKGEWIDDP